MVCFWLAICFIPPSIVDGCSVDLYDTLHKILTGSLDDDDTTELSNSLKLMSHKAGLLIFDNVDFLSDIWR